MPIGPKRMPLLEHIDELRRRIIIVVATIVVLSMVFYFWSWEILDVIMAPIMPYLGDQALNVLGPFESFTFRFKVAFYAAVVVGSPIIIYNILAFMLPALKAKERKYLLPTVFAGIVLFIAGNLFAYYVVLGPAFEWMLGQADADIVKVLPEASRFLTGVTLMMLGFGLAFEIPIVIFYLVAFDIVSYAKLRANWRVSYVTLLIVASVATPDWSPMTMGLLFAALLALYEGSLLMARLLLSKRIKAQNADDGDDDGGDE